MNDKFNGAGRNNSKNSNHSREKYGGFSRDRKSSRSPGGPRGQRRHGSARDKTRRYDGSMNRRSREIKERFLNLARLKIKSLSTRPDLAIIHISRLMIELDDIINTLSGRLYDWFSVYSNEALDRKKILEYAGSNLSTDDKYAKNGINILFGEIQRLVSVRTEYKDMLDKSMGDVAPNMAALVGADLGAKLIAHVGSLQKLAILPASTIQVMGAEKALFKHLKNKSISPPKHGIIFQHPFISGVAKRLRGKMARAIANELAIAARADAFTHRDISKLLIARLKKAQTKILTSASSSSSSRPPSNNRDSHSSFSRNNKKR